MLYLQLPVPGFSFHFFANMAVIIAVIKLTFCRHSVKFLNDFALSAYEMKNNFCLFERPFKLQKNSVFLFEISFFILEILTFFLLCKLDQ